MNTYVLDVIRKYKDKGILIDTNIGLLYLVGSFDASEIRNHGRTSKYTEDDFDRISKFVAHFAVRVTTPHVLTEMSDLLGNSIDLHRVLRGYIMAADERFENSGLLADNVAFLKIGLADTAILKAAKNMYLVLTDDGPLQEFLGKSGVDFVNLEHIRMI